jgi:hypothetical protein
MVCQDDELRQCKFADICDKRNAVLQTILQREQAACVSRRKPGQPTPPVCMIRVATLLANSLRTLHEAEVSSRAGVYFYPDLTEVLLQARDDQVVHRIVDQVQPFFLRLLAALTTWEPHRYKKGFVRWMLLGMLYLCTEGLSILGVVILPQVQELCLVLPSDNKISVYFANLNVTTKCVTDMSNLIHSSIKKHPEIFRWLKETSS